jgi:adenosylmethionine-8-amino-7-oxononanoate aminotransferase
MATQPRLRRRPALWLQNQPLDAFERDDPPLVIDRGEGIYLWDREGRRYIDALSGLWVVAAGHGRTELAEAAAEQASRLAYANTFAYATEPALELAEALVKLAPPGIARVHFANSGSEAVELALKIAKQYHYNRGEGKRYKIISRIGSYHGQTAGALSVNGASYAVRPPFEPLVPGAIRVPGVNCAHCPYEKTYPSCNVYCARAIAGFIEAERPETVAAVIAEPISIANGNFVPPAEYWRTLREVCDAYGVLLIADEVINGFGRTGRWWGIDHFGIVPDLMTVAKQLSSGYAPIGAVLVHERVAAAFEGGPERAFMSGLTFAGHPVACAVARANLGILQRERLPERAASVGAHLGARLREIARGRRVVADVRGIGLLWALEIVRDRDSGEPFPSRELSRWLESALQRRGLLTRAGSLLFLAPPLVTDREEADAIADIVDDALAELERGGP